MPGRRQRSEWYDSPMPDRLTPPGETTVVRAERVLVLAPHADDDVLGCGGLLARLAAGGAAVRVLFLTDSSGGDEVLADRRAYAERRGREAVAALRILGIDDSAVLDVPDGRAASRVDELVAGIRDAILGHRPDLLLCPSPLEVTSDHRAAFAALYEVLSPLRGGTDLDEIAGGLDILLYEINHPGYPNVLVDVSAELELLEASIREHASQLELHDYLAAALGMRRYRTLSLPPRVRAAEAYRRLTPSDLTTRSLSELVRHLGGVPELIPATEGPLVSVVVRTKDRPGLLAQALASLAAGTYRRVEVVLVNDGGEPPALPEDYPLEVVRVDLEANRGRAAAANAGIERASGEWIGFLDDDDLAYPEHLETLVAATRAAGVQVAYTDAAVGVYELSAEGGWREAERRLPYSRDFDPELLLVDNYLPFNTLLIRRELLAEAGPVDESLPFFEDWDLLVRLAALAPFHHLSRVTCEYRHFRGGAHHVLGERPAERADFLAMKAQVIERHFARLEPEVIARIVDRLRSESVRCAEQAAARSRDAERLRRAHAELEDSWHRLNGERDSLRREREVLLRDMEAAGDEIERLGSRAKERTKRVADLETEIGRLYGEERRLHDVLAERDEHVRRLSAEIERHQELIAAMEGTRAWRLHRFLERLRGRS